MTRQRDKRLIVPVLSLALIGLAGGCSDVQSALGYTKESPDEFQVVARAPLSLPPNYDLRPPEPGAERPQERTTTAEAADKILGRRRPAADASVFGAGPTVQPAATPAVGQVTSGEAVLREQLRLSDAKPGIRQIVNQETAAFVYDDKYPIDYLLFWKDDPPKGVLVDPDKESRRLRENAALGNPPNAGLTPIIERKRGGLLSGIF